MAYVDQFALRNNATIIQKTTIAVAKSAQYVLNNGGNPTANMKAFAKIAMSDAEYEARKFLWYVVVDATVIQDGASVADSVIQTIVDTNYPTLWA